MIDGSMAARDSIGAEVDGWRSAAAASAKCDFSGKSHSNISMEDSAKLALLDELHRVSASSIRRRIKRGAHGRSARRSTPSCSLLRKGVG